MSSTLADRADVPARLLLGIFALALLVRLAALAVTGPREAGDTHVYVDAARSLATLGLAGLASLRIETAPLYSVLLVPGVLLPFLPILWFAALLNAVLGAATAPLIARFTARGARNALAGTLAGTIFAVHLTSVFWGVYVLSDTLFLFVLAVCCDRLLALPESERPFLDGLLATLAAGVAVVSRPTATPFVLSLPLFLLVVVLARRRDALRLLAGVATPLLAAALAFLVMTWPTPGTAGAGLVNRLGAYANSALYIGILWTEEGRATGGVDLGVSPPPVLARMSESERADFLSRNVADDPLGFFLAEPGFFAAQAAAKLKTFWTPVLPEYSPAHALLRIVYFVPLYVLAIVGAVASWRRPAFLALMLLGILSFTLISIVTFVDYDQRYRLPAELFAIALAGAGLVAIARRVWKGASPPA